MDSVHASQVACLYRVTQQNSSVTKAAGTADKYTLRICLATASSSPFMVRLQKASVATERVSATLNAGQSVVLTLGLTAVLAMAASGGTGAGVTAGDLVCCSSCHHWSVLACVYQVLGRCPLSQPMLFGSGWHCWLFILCCHMLCHHRMCRCSASSYMADCRVPAV